MAATSIRVAYALFFFSFSMWIAILLSVCFQNGQLANPIQFPSYAFLGVFIVSAVASSIACMIIGFEYLGLGNEFAKRVRAIDKAQGSKVRLKTTSIKAESEQIIVPFLSYHVTRASTFFNLVPDMFLTCPSAIA